MIRIDKPQAAPPVLQERGRQLKTEACTLMDARDPPRMQFDRTVFGAPEVRATLRAAQHGKCCFCESKLDHCSFSDVEHFRPTGSVRQSPDHDGEAPGYYWLAYEWSNLYLACTQCNRHHKRDVFPLEHDDRRVRSHHDAWRIPEERPMFIDPGVEEPRAHIRFRRAYAAPVSIRGYDTIKGLGLNRPALREERQRQREVVIGLLTCVGLWIGDGQEPLAEAQRPKLVRALQIVGELASDGGPFAAMCRATLEEMIPWHSFALPLDAERTLAQLQHDAQRGHRVRTPSQ